MVRNEKIDRSLNYRWSAANRDCAGLVRYIFHEALSPHGDGFFARYREMRRLGNYSSKGELSRVAGYWSANNHVAPDVLRHCRYLGRDGRSQKLQTGDLLYYESAERRLRHVMLIVSPGSRAFLVYHTGDQRDELRLRTFDDMRALAEAHWHPDPQNPAFRGIYRPHFLD